MDRVHGTTQGMNPPHATRGCGLVGSCHNIQLLHNVGVVCSHLPKAPMYYSVYMFCLVNASQCPVVYGETDPSTANRFTTQNHAHIQNGCPHTYDSILEPEYAVITAGPNYAAIQVNTEPQNRHRYETSHTTSGDISSGYAVLEPKSPAEANSPSPEPPGGPLEHSLMEMSVEEFPFKQECRELIMDLPGSPKLIRKQEGGNPALRSMSCVDQYPFEQSPYMEPVSIHRNHANSRPLSMDFDYISRNMGTLLERIRSEDL